MNGLFQQRKYWLHYYCITECLMALDTHGVLQTLVARQSATAADLARASGTDARMLAAVLDFLSVTTPLLVRVGDRYEARPEARARVLSFMLDIGGAYRPVFRDLPELLSGVRKYGVDTRRDGDRVQRASARATRGAIPFVARRFAEHGVRTVVDLGCGAGELLVSLCAAEGVDGYGIDADPASLAAASAKGLEVRPGNIEDPSALDHVPRDKPIGLCAMGVMHEFLRDGEEALVALLARYRQRFPGAVFAVVEFDAVSVDEMAATDDEEMLLAASYYQLIHPLSGQGDPQPEVRWLTIFERAGWRAASVDRAPFRMVVYTLTPA